jgi:hypothetical protein
MTLIVSAMLVWLALLVAGETPTGRLMKRLLVTAPARIFNRVTGGHVLLTMILVAGAGAIVAVFDLEMLRVVMMATPEITSALMALEVTTLLDTILVTVTAASAVRWRALVGRVRRPARARARRSRASSATPRTAANDDEPRERQVA